MARLRAGGVPLVATLLTPPTGSWSTGQVDRLAVGSDALRSDYAAGGLAPEHLAVVPPAVAPPATPRMFRDEFLAAMELPADAQLITIVGPLLRAKRFDEAIWCFELVRTLNERAALVIFGDGPDRQRLERFTRLVSEPSAVKFLGYRDDLGSLLNHVNVFWHPSEEPSISGALLEAMAGRVPVIASDVPVHRELIEHGHTGFLSPVGSRAGLARHTLRLLENDELAREIGRAASAEVVQRFSAAAMTAAYRDVYNQLLGHRVEAA
jgi:glycosyltransferase involved in cell wall biosynthesis